MPPTINPATRATIARYSHPRLLEIAEVTRLATTVVSLVGSSDILIDWATSASTTATPRRTNGKTTNIVDLESFGATRAMTATYAVAIENPAVAILSATASAAASAPVAAAV